MIDHLVGRPSPSWKRAQVFIVVLFWLWRIVAGNPSGPRIPLLRRLNRLLQRFTPWQIVASVLTSVYCVRNFDKILGLGSPEPLARLYSPSYYRATWIVTGLDAGFATAMSIKPKWFRDLCSVVFALYYIAYPNEADEKLRRFRAVPTVQMLRSTWEKTTNPYIRIVTHLPRISIRRKILLPRPRSSTYTRPISAYLFFSGSESALSSATDLILDYPGGGFVAMTPEHHEERLRTWALMTGKPVLSIDYGKAPEYPYPFAIDESFDTYKLLVESAGTAIAMSGRKLSIIITGDSAGAALAVNVIIKILEHNNTISIAPSHASKPLSPLPQPLALVLNYAALDFNFTSWMSADHLRILRSEQSSGNLPGLKELVKAKDHLQHISPLSMVGDNRPGRPKRKGLKRRTSWKDALTGLGQTSGTEPSDPELSPVIRSRKSTASLRTPPSRSGRQSFGSLRIPASAAKDNFGTRARSMTQPAEDKGTLADAESSDDDEEYDYNQFKEEDRPISARVRYLPKQQGGRAPWSEEKQKELEKAIVEADTDAATKGKIRAGTKEEPIGTRLTMTSRTGFFQDRVISPSMMRAMAILYIGPYRNPDFTTDYHLSPILTPANLLAQFPPILMQCGEKDPFVDDTVIFCGRLRQAKRARKMELDLMISGKSARFGEGLRMSESNLSSEKMEALRKERDRLANEVEEDWVQMVLFSEWSHGYLQMPTLMSEAQAVIEELADWMSATFEIGQPGSGTNLKADILGDPITNPSLLTSASETETDDTGITFMPKKYAALSRRNSPYAAVMEKEKREFQGAHRKEGTARRDSSSGSDVTLQEALLSDKEKGRPRNASPRPVPVRTDMLGPLEVEYEHENDGSSSPGGAGRRVVSGTGGPRQAGEKISETELMRRRRLLDSHIFTES